MSNTTEQEERPATDEVRVNGLVREVRDGSMSAFDELVLAFQGPIFNLAFRMTNSREDANDLTQEVFVKAYRAIDRFRGDAKFSTWLYALAANACRSRLRKTRRISFFEVKSLNDDGGPDGAPAVPEPADPGDLPGKSMEREEVRSAIGRLVAGLPEEFRAVVVMRDMQGLSYEEIAVALKCSDGTVKSRLARGRARLRDKLKREGLLCAAKT
jgi:RNA polymerase sigma-70 factor (ECF subfamily)